MGSSFRRAICLVALAATVLLSLITCGRDHIEVRLYREVTVAPTPVSALFDSTGSKPGGEAAPAHGWRWITPGGWSDLPGDGLRLARFGIPGGGESSVVVLAGAAGGVEENVRRWLTQLGLELSSSGFQMLLEDAMSVQSDLDFTVFDFTSLVAGPGDTAFLTAIAAVGGQTLFVKAEAQAGVLAEQREAFVELLRSLALDSSSGAAYAAQE